MAVLTGRPTLSANHTSQLQLIMDSATLTKPVDPEPKFKTLHRNHPLFFTPQ